MAAKKTTFLLITLCLLLGAAIVLVYMGTDRKGPEISFSADVPSYKEGDSTDGLLANVTAYDDTDKDVTSSVMVDSVTPLLDGETAKVTYVVKDSHNNITVAEQTVTYQGDGEATEAAQVDDAGTGESEATTAPAQTSAEANTSATPVLVLNQTSVTLNRGETFVYYDYITSMTDDKDSSEYLAQHIHVEGDTSTNTTGTKEIVYYLVDSDGNQSERQTLTLTVQ